MMHTKYCPVLMVLALAIVAGCSSESGSQSEDGDGSGGEQSNVTPTAAAAEAVAVRGWLQWRGPQHDGASPEKGLPTEFALDGDGKNLLWDMPVQGRGSVVVADFGEGDERAYIWGYRGETTDLREVLICADSATGKVHWEKEFFDFISDIIYNRYSIGAPAIDAETGNVFLMTTPGLVYCFDRDGKELWQRSMMEEFGRLTFPNGRTGAVAIEGDLAIVNAITSNWGGEGPARNRFYAFDKSTGDLVWSSTPGVGPPFLKDSSFCQPLFETREGRRVFYVGTGCGNVACVDVATGRPLFRYQLAAGGVNSQPIVVGDKLIAVHGKENVDDTGSGRMIAIDLKKAFAAVKANESAADAEWPVVLDTGAEVWRNNEIRMFTSSPVALHNRVYQSTIAGELFCVNADSGETVWHTKVGADQLHASGMVTGDGTIYLPTWHDGIYIFKPTDEGMGKLQQLKLEGDCIGSPTAWRGKVYVHTTKRLYCFGQDKGDGFDTPAVDLPATTATHAVPKEFLLKPGEKLAFKVTQGGEASASVSWEKFIPPTAKVKSKLSGAFDEAGHFVASTDAKYSAGALRATVGEAITTVVRGRILPSPPFAEDFETFELDETSEVHGEKYAYPPLPWIGARLKWEVRDVGEGNKALTKTLDRVLFQRSMVFIGHADDSNYTVQADVMTDGNRRVKGDVGVVNQRYIIALRGNNRILEVQSNHDRFKHSVPFNFKPKTWYTLKTRVDVAGDGSGVIRAKAWPRGEEEPAAWTIEVEHDNVHKNGSPGLYGLSPQSLFPVYIDNIKVVGNRD